MGSPVLGENARTLAEVASALNAAHPLGQNFPALFFFTDEERVPQVLSAIDGLPLGCAVIFRHYQILDRHKLARSVVSRCHEQNRLCLVAGDVDLARALDADGVHLPEYLLADASTLDLNGFELNTAAAHNSNAIQMAEEAGVNAIFLSPVFETQSHAGKPALGLDNFHLLMNSTSLPAYALGGITKKTAPQLAGYEAEKGPIGIGAIGALLD